MQEGKAAVGVRIRECAWAREIRTAQNLFEVLLSELKKTGSRQTLTRQTVSNWWHGKVYPSLDMLPVLAAALKSEPEYILFGKRRGEQLKEERHWLSRVNDTEGELLTLFRTANINGQKSILKMAKALAEDHPAEKADIHHMRRRDDKLGNDR